MIKRHVAFALAICTAPGWAQADDTGYALDVMVFQSVDGAKDVDLSHDFGSDIVLDIPSAFAEVGWSCSRSKLKFEKSPVRTATITVACKNSAVQTTLASWVTCKRDAIDSATSSLLLHADVKGVGMDFDLRCSTTKKNR